MTFAILSTVKNILEITILWFVFYRILIFFEGTRAFQVLKGLLYLMFAFLISQYFGLDTLNWLLTKFFGISIIAFLIIFQQELRQGLARLGQQHLFSITLEESEMLAVLEEISNAVSKLARNKIGCIIAIERESKLKTYIESGILIDAKISSELIQSIFVTTSPIHDGGVITRGDRVIAASCLFPLSENPNLGTAMGTRHRAALGLSEQTDAVVVMVSEETTTISVAVNGRFVPIPDRDQLFSTLRDVLIKQNKKKKS